MPSKDPFYELKCEDHYHSVEIKNNSVLVFSLGVMHQLVPQRLQLLHVVAKQLLDWCRKQHINVYPAVLLLERGESLSTVSDEYMRKAGWVPETEIEELNRCIDKLSQRLSAHTDKSPAEIRDGMMRQVRAELYQKEKG